LASSSHRSRDDGREGPAIQDQEEVAMFGFMLDETDGADSKALATCRTCHIRLASRAARVVDGELRGRAQEADGQAPEPGHPQR
jgi:hypothetical protein